MAIPGWQNGELTTEGLGNIFSLWVGALLFRPADMVGSFLGYTESSKEDIQEMNDPGCMALFQAL